LYKEIFIQATQTYLHSDPVTCVGCAAFSVSSAWCRELRQDDTCQKRLSAQRQLLDVIVRLVENGHSDVLALVTKGEVK